MSSLAIEPEKDVECVMGTSSSKFLKVNFPVLVCVCVCVCVCVSVSECVSERERERKFLGIS